MSLRASSSTINANATPSPARSIRAQPSVVVTSPPWAKDEPPSPTDEPFADTHHATESRPSVASFQSTNVSNEPSRWFAFTRPRGASDATGTAILPQNTSPTNEKADRKSVSFSWLPTQREGSGSSFPRRNRQPSRTNTLNRNWNLSITLPTPPAASFTTHHNVTPGWDVPWTSRVGAQGPAGRYTNESSGMTEDEETSPVDSEKEHAPWRTRRKRLRSFILSNTYVPLLFRLVNISFTTAALAIAIRIRLTERRLHTMGELGSSPTLVIIFSPLTLLNVMTAIYLEYFGRPLGLWRTSHKLAHTLSEVLFICAWSAALSLCFDNFFTSSIPCSSAKSVSWYSTIPRPTDSDPVSGDKRCDDQLALIVLVGIGLLAYCTNLVISLFRIFEKVKYHPAAGTVDSSRGIWRR